MKRRQHGVVLTYVDTLDQLADCVRRGGYDTVKVITGWGVANGWSRDNKARVLSMVPNVIVRTVAGDPSAGQPPGQHSYPYPDNVEQELREWYSIKPNILIEIGNEPNINSPTDEFIWNWRYHLAAAIERCRQVFPRAHLISPGLIMRDSRRFCEICHDVMRECDYIGIHFYEFYGFLARQQPATTNDVRDAVALFQEFFRDKPWYVTEYGINDSKEVSIGEKGQRYAGIIQFDESQPVLPPNVKGAVYYHLAFKGDLHPEYHIYPEGDEAYLQRLDAVPRTGPLVAGTRGMPTEPTTTPEDTLSKLLRPLVPQLSEIIATLADWERGATALRAETLSLLYDEDEDEDEMSDTDDDIDLQRVQALRSMLEAALSCVQNNTLVAQQLIVAAMSQVNAWAEREEQMEA